MLLPSRNLSECEVMTTLEDRGYARLVNRGILDLGFASWLASAAIVGSLFHRLGASSAASAVGGIGVGVAASKMARWASRDPESGVGAEEERSSRIYLSLDVGEVILTPFAAGLALLLSTEEGRRRDAKVLFGTAAIGAGATMAVLLSQSKRSS